MLRERKCVMRFKYPAITYFVENEASFNIGVQLLLRYFVNLPFELPNEVTACDQI